MAVNENDFELLNAYLDGELPVAECEGLWRRLAIERELMSELDSLRADHSVRGMVWSGLDPGDHAVARLEARVMRASRREDLLDRFHYISRVLTTVAALVLFGFSIGWLGRDHYSVLPGTTLSVPSNSPQSASMGPQLPQMTQVPSGGKVSVEVDDGSGKPLHLSFDSAEEANRFIHDFRSGRAAAPSENGEPSVVPPMEKF